MRAWRTATIADLTTRTASGGTPSRKHPEYFTDEQDGIPWVRSQELVDRRISRVGEHITDEGLEKSSAKLFPPSTVLVAMYGATVGQLGFLDIEAATNQAICALITDPEVTDARFLYYALMGSRHKLVSQAQGAAQQNLSQAQIRKFSLQVPDLATQRTIANLLGSIDDLIENDRRRIEVLEEMAQAIYREWFVHFRFPGHENAAFVDSPLGPIPEGWTGATFSDLVTLVKETVSPEAIEQGAPVVGLEHIPREQLTLDDWEEAAEVGSRRGMFRRGDILFGKIRPYFHKVSVAPFDGYCSTDAMVFRPTGNLAALAASVAFSRAFVDVATATSNGTKMPRANWEVLSAHPVAVPSVALLERFNDLFSHSVEQCRALMLSNKVLAATRDRLLPKLVSGEIDVSDLDLDDVLEGAV